MLRIVFFIVIPLIRSLVHFFADVARKLRARLKARSHVSLGSASLSVELVLRGRLHFDQIRYLARVVRRSPTFWVERASKVLGGLLANILLLTAS